MKSYYIINMEISTELNLLNPFLCQSARVGPHTLLKSSTENTIIW